MDASIWRISLLSIMWFFDSAKTVEMSLANSIFLISKYAKFKTKHRKSLQIVFILNKTTAVNDNLL